MRILISQPVNLYYAWQVETQLSNFIEMSVSLSMVDIVCSGVEDYNWKKLRGKYKANFYYYPNTSTSNYPSISRPNALKQHFEKYPCHKTFFYIDCDVLFLKQPVWLKEFIKQDHICYVSDTKYYIGYSYFKSKGLSDEILADLCTRVGLGFNLLPLNDDHSGGAQYILKNIDSSFWWEVEKDCDIIYNYFNYNSYNSINNRYFKSEEDGIQSFCSDMWAVLWNLWKRRKEVKVVPELDFAWPTYNYEDKEKYNIFHNAGILNENEGMFWKQKYRYVLPYNDNFSEFDQSKLSYFYIQHVLDLKNTTVL